MRVFIFLNLFLEFPYKSFIFTAILRITQHDTTRMIKHSYWAACVGFTIQSVLVYLSTAEPAKCESDEDCFKGRAKCIRKECHCTGHFVGDGKTKCDRKSVVPSNFYLLIQKRCKYYMHMLPYENDVAFTPRLF